MLEASISKTTLTTPLNIVGHREEDKGRFAKEIESGRVELQSYSDESSLVWEAESKSSQTSFGSAAKTKHGEVERKKGTPWTEEEHSQKVRHGRNVKQRESYNRQHWSQTVMSAIAVSVCFGDACWSGFFFLVFWGCLDPSFCAGWFKSLLEGQFLLVPLLVPFKSDLDSSFITLEKYKEQLMVILEYVSRIEEEIKKLKSMVEEEETKLDSSALMVVTECCTEKEKESGRKWQTTASGNRRS
ncbi:hypothetical protein LOK49_LG13G01211 [Camellia lanceoleosa]|uniref:Uncharacterized protein n=1 Tax=Camellia lanceoleosa TaxID=1840588 RepID=A0ACC0FMJ9_9ERIC|nr:hypothetical protein LOK49_LG13G01211 [Camellia lanceoleosa]